MQDNKNTELTPQPISLAVTEQHAHAKKLVTSEFSKTMEWKQSPRPCYDMVEEYNRSLDEYKDKVRRTSTQKQRCIYLFCDWQKRDLTKQLCSPSPCLSCSIPPVMECGKDPRIDCGGTTGPFLTVTKPHCLRVAPCLTRGLSSVGCARWRGGSGCLFSGEVPGAA